jgi:RimJ/RimL family protein N-acetyltransferase
MHPESARLIIREMAPDDLDDMALLLGDPEVMTYYPRPKTRDEAVRWIEWNRALYRTHGYGLCGYATEAAAASRDFARDVLGATRLIAIIHPDNRPSQRVAEKIGLHPEKRTAVHGGRDAIIYAATFD